MQCLNAQCFLNLKALLGAPDVPIDVSARDAGWQSHHRLERPGRIIRARRYADACVEKTAQREHVIEPFSAIFAHFFAVIINISGKRRWDRSERFDASDK